MFTCSERAAGAIYFVRKIVIRMTSIRFFAFQLLIFVWMTTWYFLTFRRTCRQLFYRMTSTAFSFEKPHAFFLMATYILLTLWIGHSCSTELPTNDIRLSGLTRTILPNDKRLLFHMRYHLMLLLNDHLYHFDVLTIPQIFYRTTN